MTPFTKKQIRISWPDQYRGLVLEAAAGKKPTLRLPKDLNPMPPNSYCVGIIGVAHVTVRGFRFDAAKGGRPGICHRHFTRYSTGEP